MQHLPNQQSENQQTVVLMDKPVFNNCTFNYCPTKQGQSENFLEWIKIGFEWLKFYLGLY